MVVALFTLATSTTLSSVTTVIRLLVLLAFAGVLGVAGAQSVAPSVSQSVSLVGLLGPKALLVIDGGAPKALAVGESHQGVKLLSMQGDRAVVEMGSAKQNLRLGDVPVSVSTGGVQASSGGRIVLPAGTGGHFSAQGLINGKPVTMLVDTGATTIAIGKDEAERLGLAYKTGQQVRMQTANGASLGWRLKLANVRVGDVDVYDVDAVVTPAPMPFVLLGNSFLTRFQMNRNNDQLVLVKRF